MKISIAQINPTLADFKANKEKILNYVNQAVQQGSDLVVFPECSIFGYHPFDLLEHPALVLQQEKEFKDLQKKLPPDIGVIVGLIMRNPAKKGRPYFNSAALISKNKKPVIFNKQLLPTGDVFDEARFIEAGNFSNNYFTWKGKKFFLTICEDIWAWPDSKGNSPYKENPLAKVKKKKVDLIINLSASPYHVGKMKRRMHVTHQTAKYFNAPLLYTNLVGGQDEIIFDGASFIIGKDGKLIGRCEQFQEDFKTFDLNNMKSLGKVPALKVIKELNESLVLGIRDFCNKSGISKVHLGLSGGIDSALVAVLAVQALGKDNVAVFALPSKFNAPESFKLAKQLAINLGLELHEVPIKNIYESVVSEVEKSLEISGFSIVHENIQARLRGLLLMAYSNSTNSMLLTTSNKSEMACGYATMYGDMCGGLAPIGDLTKTQVYELSNWYNRDQELIPKMIIDRAPSAELRPNQKDQDSLPPYEVLDQSVINLIEHSKSPKNATDKWLSSLMLRTEFKRWQAAPILKVSIRAFGRGRRYPIAHKAQI